MNRRWLLLLLLAGACVTRAQEPAIPLEEVLSAAEDWVQENLDPDALRSLTGVEKDEAQRFLNDLQQRLAGQYLVELGPLKETVQTVLPLLEGHPDTRPYAVWLRTRLDYFDVAERLGRTPPPRIAPSSKPTSLAIPAPDLSRKAWLEVMEQRPVPPGAGNYVTRLKPIFAAQKVPPELVWLAEVESSFNPTARSPAGAAGLYQLMPATARQIGLTVGARDERFSPEQSARAAATHLRHLHGRFKDWRLALAAYNAGEGRVQRLLERHRARNFETIAAHLPAETQLYVPKVESTLWRREGITLAKLRSPTG